MVMKTFKLNNLDLSNIGVNPVVRPTGILPLDIATGVGGFRSGMFIEIWGPESSGKTLIALIAAIQAQKDSGKPSLLVDAEYAWDPTDERKVSYQVEWFKKLGGNLDLFELHYPEGSEKVYDEMTNEWIPSNKYAYIIIDSWKAMMPTIKLEKDIGDKKKGAFGAAALTNSEFLIQALSKLFRSQTTVICVNHEMRDFDIKFGDPRTTGGGRALKYYAKQRINTLIAKQRSELGVTIDGVVNKNKVAPPFKTFQFPVSFETGVDREMVAFNMGVECGIIGGGSGGSYDFRGVSLKGGRQKIVDEIFRSDSLLVNSIEELIKERFKPATDTSIEEHAGG